MSVRLNAIGKLLVLGLYCLSICGCAVVGYKKGLVIQDVEVKKGSLVGFIHLESPPVDIRVVGNPRSNILAVSPPVVPIPVIPWPPGILDVLIHRHSYSISDQPLTMQIFFHARNVNRTPALTTFIFSSKDAKLVQDGRTLPPSSVTWACAQDKGQECRQLPDGRYIVTVRSSLAASLTLQYDVPMSAISAARFEIGKFLYEDQETTLKFLIKRGPSIRVEYVGP